MLVQSTRTQVLCHKLEMSLSELCALLQRHIEYRSITVTTLSIHLSVKISIKREISCTILPTSFIFICQRRHLAVRR